MFIAAIAVSLALAPSPLEQGDVRCILERMPAAERHQVAQAALDGDSASDSMANLNAAIDACIGSLDWDEENAGTMSGLAMAIILRDDAGLGLGRQGISSAAIDAWFDRQDADFRVDPEVTDVEASGLIQTLIEAGTAGGVLDAHGGMIGTYLGARIMIERVERGLPLE